MWLLIQSPRFNLILATLFSLMIVTLALLPPDLVVTLGCRNRGLWAVVVALTSGICSLVWASLAVAGRIRGQATGKMLFLSIAYVLPLLLVLWFA